jgi:hypothetical protein
MRRITTIALAGFTALVGAVALPVTAQAGDRHGWGHPGRGWGPPHHRHYRPQPPRHYYAPPPRVYYAPPPRVYYAPPPAYYAPPPAYYYGPPGVSLNFRF